MLSATGFSQGGFNVNAQHVCKWQVTVMWLGPKNGFTGYFRSRRNPGTVSNRHCVGLMILRLGETCGATFHVYGFVWCRECFTPTKEKNVIKIFSSTIVLAAGALTLATPAVSEAGHHGCGYSSCQSYSHYGHHYYSGGHYYGYSYRPSWGYSYPMVYVAPAAPTPNTASIHVTAPAGAKVSCGGVDVIIAGERVFESPVLNPGQDYQYDVTAQWIDPYGKQITQKQRVHVSANASVHVDFPAPVGN
jgi:uncharacterized protein (TIGR03000 family)